MTLFDMEDNLPAPVLMLVVALTPDVADELMSSTPTGSCALIEITVPLAEAVTPALLKVALLLILLATSLASKAAVVSPLPAVKLYG